MFVYLINLNIYFQSFASDIDWKDNAELWTALLSEAMKKKMFGSSPSILFLSFHPVIIPFFTLIFLVITVCLPLLLQTHWFG